VYSRKQLAIPTPEFYAFYNGKESYSDNSVLKLSDAFIQKHDKYALELSVKVININYDKGSRILKSCKPLELTVQVLNINKDKGNKILKTPMFFVKQKSETF